MKELGLWISFLLKSLVFQYRFFMLIGLKMKQGIVNTTSFYFISNSNRNLPGQICHICLTQKYSVNIRDRVF